MLLHDLPKRYQDQAGAQLYAKPNPSRPLQDTKPQRLPKTALGSTVSGEAPSMERITVRFTGYRVRPLDPDNFAGSTKALLDGLRHAKLIHGDENWRIILETAQVRVKSFKEECTVIEIIPMAQNLPNNL